MYVQVVCIICWPTFLPFNGTSKNGFLYIILLNIYLSFRIFIKVYTTKDTVMLLNAEIHILV